MTDEERDRRIAELITQEHQAPQRWWYLSFASAEGFLGVCWVKAGGLVTAAQVAHACGINPGGQVAAKPLPFEHDPPKGSDYKLHRDRAEIDRLYREWVAKGDN